MVELKEVNGRYSSLGEEYDKREQSINESMKILRYSESRNLKAAKILEEIHENMRNRAKIGIDPRDSKLKQFLTALAYAVGLDSPEKKAAKNTKKAKTALQYLKEVNKNAKYDIYGSKHQTDPGLYGKMQDLIVKKSRLSFNLFNIENTIEEIVANQQTLTDVNESKGMPKNKQEQENLEQTLIDYMQYEKKKDYLEEKKKNIEHEFRKVCKKISTSKKNIEALKRIVQNVNVFIRYIDTLVEEYEHSKTITELTQRAYFAFHDSIKTAKEQRVIVKALKKNDEQAMKIMEDHATMQEKPKYKRVKPVKPKCETNPIKQFRQDPFKDLR